MGLIPCTYDFSFQFFLAKMLLRRAKLPAEGRKILSESTAVTSNIDERGGLLPVPRDNIRQEPKLYTPTFGTGAPIGEIIHDKAKSLRVKLKFAMLEPNQDQS